MEDRTLIDRFSVKNFRSVQESEAKLGPLTFFIGANGSGKTSFVDAIRFVASALQSSLEEALRIRGAIYTILYHPKTHVTFPAHARFDLETSSTSGLKSEFHLELRVSEGWSVSVAREECTVEGPGGERHYYLVENGSVRGSAAVFPAVSADRIFLSNASGLPEFRTLFDFLSGIRSTEPISAGVYDFSERLGRLAKMEGLGLTARFHRLSKADPDRLEIIQQYLRAVAPPFDRIEFIESSDGMWLQFVEESRSGGPTRFYISQSSAGLVNAAEILLELFQPSSDGKPASPVIIEEPEAMLHPGAIQVMRDAFLEASRFRQVLVTTHSPDLLDDPSIRAEWIRAVHKDEEGTHIDPIDSDTQSVIRDRLYTAGQLLRQGGLSL
ncbi:MAG TPA: AAA family ATPase [Bryobacteraceae bacterium]|jgi:predicted ATPase|nr:AAA family ATPase [Bryobacteraceae bacterium]